MKINQGIKKTVAMTLVGSMALSTFAFADVTKEESVYVNLDANGQVEKVFVSNWLHTDEQEATIADKSILQSIENIKSDVMPVISGENVTWEVDNHDIYYRGTTDQALPLDIEVSYIFEGEAVKPSEILGKSGSLELRMNLKNNEVTEVNGEEVYVPFTVVSVLNLPEAIFKNLEVNLGKVVNDGTHQVVTYIALPGMKENADNNEFFDIEEELIIKAEVENFEMESIYITAVAEIPEMEKLDELDKVSDLIEGIEELSDASEKLAEGTDKLAKGNKTLNENLKKLEIGVNGLTQGAKDLKDAALKIGQGSQAAYEGAEKVAQGTKELSENALVLGGSAVKLGAGMTQFSESAVQFAKGAEQVSSGVTGIAPATKALKTGAEQLTAGAGKLEVGQGQVVEGIKKSEAAIAQLKLGKQNELKMTTLLLEGLTKFNAKVNNTELAITIGQVSKLNEGSKQYIAALEELEEGLKAVELGAASIKTELGTLKTGEEKLVAGLDQLDKGAESLVAAGAQLSEGSAGLGAGAESINGNTLALNEGFKRFNEGSQALVVGSAQVAGGLQALSAGAEQFTEGADQFGSGAQELEVGAKQLSAGSDELTEGINSLDENMQKFNKEGVKKLDKEVTDGLAQFDNLKELKEELIVASDSYNSFSGIGENMDGSVKFILKTEEIKIEKVEAEKVVVEEKKEGFFQWIKSLF